MARYDLHLRLLDPTAQAHGANFALPFDEVYAVSGKQKLANRWLMTFMTPKGSHPLRRTYGTEFPFLIGGNNVAEGSLLEPVVMEHVEDCNAQLRAVDRRSPWLTAEERLRSATLAKFIQLDATRYEFWIDLYNEAGTNLRILIPLLRG
jgi:hypothetical protein